MYKNKNKSRENRAEEKGMKSCAECRHYLAYADACKIDGNNVADEDAQSCPYYVPDEEEEQ